MDLCAVLVDPFVFLVPEDCDRRGCLRFLEHLVEWGSALRQSESCTSERAVSALRIINRYPTLEVIRKMISSHAIEMYSPVDVQNALRVLSDKAPYAEERFEIRELAAQTTLDPASMQERLPIDVARPFMDMLVSGIIATQAHESDFPEVGTYDVFEGVPEANEEARLAGGVIVRSEVGLVESYDGSIAEPLRQILEQRLQLLQSPPEAEKAAWVTVCHEPAVAFAFAVDLLRTSDASLPEVPAPRVGPDFVGSLERLGLLTQPALLLRLYRLAVLAAAGRLANTSGAKLHAVRESKAASAPQLTRENGDRKWRCMLSKTGAGFRLHYWECRDGAIELAEVVVESEV
jgi:hypothetical protein